MKKLVFLFLVYFISNCIYAQTWNAVGNGVNGRVSCFAIYNGELYVAGQFNNPGGVSPIGLMKWNGTEFDTLPGNYLLGASRVEAMAVYNNELYLGGGFSTSTTLNPSVFNYIAKWDGSNFTAVGNGCDNVVYSMAVYKGNLYIGGDMETAGSVTVNSIAKWNGSQWLAVGGGINNSGRVTQLLEYNNELYAAGNFFFSSLNNTSCIARWNDTTWNEVGIGGINGVVYALGTFNNEIYAGGPYFTQAGGVPVNDIAKWNGTTWASAGTGIGYNTGHIFALKEYQNELYVGGIFNVMDGDSMNCITRYNGSNYNSVGTGIDSTNIIIDTIIDFPWGDTTFIYPTSRVSTFIEFNNELYVGGIFNMIGGVTAHSVARWSTLVNVEEHSNLKTVVVFPNPNTGNYSIEINTLQDENYTIDIFDENGKIIYTEKGKLISGSNTLPISSVSFAAGIYFVKIKTDTGVMDVKVVVE